jgi:hypothetical protein
MGRLTIDKLLRTRYIKVVVRHGDKRNLVTEKEESPVMKFGLAVSFDSIMGTLYTSYALECSYSRLSMGRTTDVVVPNQCVCH